MAENVWVVEYYTKRGNNDWKRVDKWIFKDLEKAKAKALLLTDGKTVKKLDEGLYRVFGNGHAYIEERAVE